jgi:hypothetical protein
MELFELLKFLHLPVFCLLLNLDCEYYGERNKNIVRIGPIKPSTELTNVMLSSNIFE